MNRRQKKKRYKKLYGHNPPKGADGRYIFHMQYGYDSAAGSDWIGYCSPEWQRIRQRCLQGPKIEISIDTEALRNAIAAAVQELTFAAAVSRPFADMAEQHRKPVIEQVEEPPVVVARNLTERRKKCRRKEWRASGK